MIKSRLKKIGVFTSGGDSPGMNACIRAVVRTAVFHGVEVAGIMKGYKGMIENDMIEMDARSVSNIIHRGGTILKTARSPEFMEEEGLQKAIDNLKQNRVEGLIAIGGDGTFRGAEELQKASGIPVMGIPGTIDNDLFGTEVTLGFDTAVNTAVEAIDKIRDTAASHDRLFFIEVMGRDSGFIALWSGIAGGAEAILLPEEKTNIRQMMEQINDGARHQKSSSIVIVCEGDDAGSATEIAANVKKDYPGFDTKVTVLGHVQRGGSPTAADRLLGSRFGVKATEALLEGKSGQMIGLLNNKISWTDFSKATKQHSKMNSELLRFVKILSI